MALSAQHAARSGIWELDGHPPSAQGSGSPARCKRQLPWHVVAITMACRGLGLAPSERGHRVRIWQRWAWALEVGYSTQKCSMGLNKGLVPQMGKCEAPAPYSSKGLNQRPVTSSCKERVEALRCPGGVEVKATQRGSGLTKRVSVCIRPDPSTRTTSAAPVDDRHPRSGKRSCAVDQTAHDPFGCPASSEGPCDPPPGAGVAWARCGVSYRNSLVLVRPVTPALA